MFYQPQDGHGLPHDPFVAIVSPRPIGWISTRGKDGHNNLAPYSFFNAIASNPPQVMFASTLGKKDRHLGKDTLANIDETGVFCVNIVGYDLRDAMNVSSGDYGADVDEFEMAGLEAAECETIACARVAAAPAALECRLEQVISLKGKDNSLIIGEVIGVHMAESAVIDGRFEVMTYRPLSRLGYRDYASVDKVFSLKRPGE